jgi:rare lipoprotein A
MKNTIIALVVLFSLISFNGISQTETGTASFYHNKFDGRRTSSGEVFRQGLYTCAHKTYPFGTMLKVTNLSNDSTVVVKVNDRLPMRSKRCIDLSMVAAKQLNFVGKGLTKVRVEKVEAN